ncbi:hypothetical protein [Arthrobacter sp. NPDC092385]
MGVGIGLDSQGVSAMVKIIAVANLAVNVVRLVITVIRGGCDL